jgi:Na+/H+ antiporter NhaC
MSIWAIVLIVVLIVALSGTGYGYAYRDPAGPAPAYTNPLGGIAALILVVLLVLWLTGNFFVDVDVP